MIFCSGFNGSDVRHLPFSLRKLLAICLSTAVLKLDHPFGSSLFRVIAALHKVFQCYSFTSHCFRVGETHAQLRSECGSYIVRARSLTKLATSAPDQECDCLANPVANFIDNIILVRIHVDFSTLADNLFMEDFDQIQLSNQLAHWWFRLESNQRHGDFQSPALPTELQNHKRFGWGLNPRPLA